MIKIKQIVEIMQNKKEKQSFNKKNKKEKENNFEKILEKIKGVKLRNENL